MTTEASTDAQLVRAALTGDVRAFGRLVERHHGAVVAVAFAITRDLAEAEDIAQETFCTAWTGLASLRDAGAVRAWLCNIARNRGRNTLRSQRRIAEEPSHLVDDTASVRDVLVERETMAAVQAALDDVPDEYREPLVLLRKGVDSQLEHVGRGRRSAVVAAAAIMAVCSTRQVASAAIASSVRTSSKVFAAGEVLVLASIVVLTATGRLPLSIGRDASAAPAKNASAQTSTTPHGHGASAPPALAAAGANATKRDPSKRRIGQLPIPPSYQLSVESPYAVSMNLSGGPSGLVPYGAASPAPSYNRTIRGRVVDGDGKGVAHAVVLVAKQFHTFQGSLLGEQGATTAVDGSFKVVVHDADAKSALAFEAQTGWSRPVSIAAGDAEATVSLSIPKPGALAGTVTRDGATIDARVTVTAAENPDVWVEVDTDTTGEFEFPLLAPGRYQVAAKPLEMFAGGDSMPVVREVTVATASRTNVTLSLTQATLVLARVKPAAGVTYQTVDHLLVPKANMPSTPTLDVLLDLAKNNKALRMLYGGSDADRDMEFHDVAPGAYSVCIDARVDWEKPAPLVCEPITVVGDKPVLEVEIETR